MALRQEQRTLLAHLSGRIWASMREDLGMTGAVPAPTIYTLDDEAITSVRCRPFYAGTDARAALQGLGRVPTTPETWAQFLIWERNDLSIALKDPIQEPFALQSLRIVRDEEAAIGSQEFDIPDGDLEQLLLRPTVERLISGTAHLPIGIQLILNTPHVDDVAPVECEKRLKELEDRGYPVENVWRAL